MLTDTHHISSHYVLYISAAHNVIVRHVAILSRSSLIDPGPSPISLKIMTYIIGSLDHRAENFPITDFDTKHYILKIDVGNSTV